MNLITFPRILARPLGVRAGAGGGVPWWADTVAAYQPIGAASLAASYINLANPGTYDATPGVAPTFDSAYGWQFNGSTQYLNTGVVPASNWSMFVQFTALASTGNVVIAGQRKAANDGMFLYPDKGATATWKYNYGTRPGLSTANRVAGNMAMAGTGCYWNGISDGIVTTASLTAQTHEIYIGAMNNAGAAAIFANVRIAAVAIYATALTPEQAATLAATMAALPL